MKKHITTLIVTMTLLAGPVFMAEPLFAQRASSMDVLDRQRQQVRPEPKSQPRIVFEGPKQEVGPDTSAPFVLNNITVEGATIFTQAELIDPHRALLGQTITFNQMLSVAEAMTLKYREAGYILSRVVLPPQSVDLAGANVRLQAIEGFITSIQYEGDPELVARFKSYFSAYDKKLLQMRPLDHPEFERIMLLMQDVPGLEISSSFQPADEATGASRLIITVKSKIWSGNFTIDNTGTNSSGPAMLSAGLQVSTLPFLGMQAGLAYGQAFHIHEYSYWNASLSHRFSSGLTLQGNYGQSYSPNPDTEFARQFDYETSSESFAIGLSYPLIRSRDMNFNLSTFFNYRDSDSDLLEADWTKDKIRNLTFTGAFDASDEWGGVNQIVLDYARGLDVFGASDRDLDSSRPFAVPDFNKVNLYLSRNQQLPNNFSVFLSGQVQLTDSILFSYDQYSLGGLQFGRGYDAGILSGDNAIAAAAEFRWTHSPSDTITLQPFAFIDWGQVKDKKVADLETNWRELSSAGAGVRLWGNYEKFPDFSTSIFAATPLRTVDDAKRDHWRIIIQQTFSF